MTPYRDRLQAGLYDPNKQDPESQKKAQAKADNLTAAKAAKSTTSDKLKGL